jgi:dephospho-CoA kinase
MSAITIGIAGYMGSGKSTFSLLLGEMGGFKVIDGDTEAKKMMMASVSIQEHLIAEFGTQIIENRTLSFKKLGKIVFNSMEKLQQFNAIVHPLLLDSLRDMIFNRYEGSMIVDAALLPLWNVENWFTERIWIDASSATRFNRILKKSSTADSELIHKRMQLQEGLFAVPSTISWKHIKNEEDIAALRRAVKLFIHA